MKRSVKLQDIIEGMEMQFEGTYTYLNLRSGEVITVSQEDLWAAEEDEPNDHFHDWQQENIKVAIDVLQNFEDYRELPTKFEINEYEMMEDFCFDLTDQQKKNTLLNAIRGRGAFKRFKALIIQMGIVDKWYAYRDECYRNIAIKWCLSHDVEYV